MDRMDKIYGEGNNMEESSDLMKTDSAADRDETGDF